MPVTVSTAETPPVTIEITVHGVALDEPGARKLAQRLRSEVCYELGYTSDEQREAVEVSLTVDAAGSGDTLPPETPENDDAPAPRAGADEIAAMNPNQYRAEKMAGRI